MKTFFRKLLIALCALSLILSLASCGKETEKTEFDREQVAAVAETVVHLMSSVQPERREEIASFDEEDLSALEMAFAQQGLRIRGSAFQSGYESYASAMETLGSLQEADVSHAVIDAEDGEITCTLNLTGTEKRDSGKPMTAEMEILLSRKLTVNGITVNQNKTFGEKITGAALNTVLGMGTTFLVLIFISLVIWLMGSIVQGMQKKPDKPDELEQGVKGARSGKSGKNAASASVPETSGQNEEALIAVIAAAIAAYESGRTGKPVSPDTFIVRSVRRRQNRRSA